ncbi:glycosyltransferase [Paractinoplanes hotanensis]|uniref:Glycosyltransferase n=1 Tax=Paractinoplanes hotanensis TaxID=2906497 RepID=A0ABT0Y4Q9_9ACTN|nr:glycosyltransferase [Actinoplanes hotanensis]MCM4081023.1 glycosyltransferase [Actinoplanes hotanensis]
MTVRTAIVAPRTGRTAPAPTFAHLARLTDDTGLFEHARNATARREHGYCTDDVARGLVVTSREPAPSAEVFRLAECYLTFLTHAQDAQGAFHNRLTFHRNWTDQPALGDWWGRALWGLGTAAARCPAPWIRQEALLAFNQSAWCRATAPRSMAFAALGAAEVVRADPGNQPAIALLADAAAVIGRPGPDPGWPWPEQRLTYANAALAEALVVAGDLLDDPPILAAGLRMLAWLLNIQTRDNHLSVLPSSGWQSGGPRLRHDQQPIEVAALADACATAAAITGEETWHTGVRRSVDWFLGANDIGYAMWDPATGGGYDGLTLHGPNLNQGAESTLALISTLQHRSDSGAGDAIHLRTD